MTMHTPADVDAALHLFPASGIVADGLVQYLLNLHILDNQGLAPRSLRPAQRIWSSVSSLLTVLERHDWQKSQASAGHLDSTSWMFFASCDVEYFYVVLRSAFDDLALLCAAIAAT